MHIIRPDILNIDEEALIVEFSTHQKVYIEGEFVDILVFPTLVLTNEKEGGGKFHLPVVDEMFTKELGYKFNNYTYGVGKIVRLGEINKDNLHFFIREYFEKNDVEAFYKRSAECEKMREYHIEKSLEILTYGNLKNIMRLIIKTDDSFYEIEELNDSSKRKKFRQIYENYVVDRDRFTHGKLFFLYPDFRPVLRVMETNGSSYYINYSKDIFLSNLEVFDYLESVISKMKQVLSKG
ncbi:MAG: hypothetical protein KF870_11470 [Leadbetterella sp.]|nr:hypothetical protein [Leadbetterella sp.]